MTARGTLRGGRRHHRGHSGRIVDVAVEAECREAMGMNGWMWAW
jgi:hypothetical protein